MSCYMQIECSENFDQLCMPPAGSQEGLDKEIVSFFSLSGVTWRLNNLLGSVLTVVDASVVDPVQRKAVKDLMRTHFWKTLDNMRYDLWHPDESPSEPAQSK